MSTNLIKKAPPIAMMAVAICVHRINRASGSSSGNRMSSADWVSQETGSHCVLNRANIEETLGVFRFILSFTVHVMFIML